MALILETGEGLPNADALISVAEVRAFAVSRGLSVPSSDGDVEVLIRKACDWLRSIEDRLQGWRRVYNQALPFPRVGVSLYGRGAVLRWDVYLNYLPEQVIPPDLKNGLCQMVFELQANDALPTVDGKVVTQETVGPISTTYAKSGVVTQNPIFPKVMAFIRPFFKHAQLTVGVNRA